MFNNCRIESVFLLSDIGQSAVVACVFFFIFTGLVLYGFQYLKYSLTIILLMFKELLFCSLCF